MKLIILLLLLGLIGYIIYLNLKNYHFKRDNINFLQAQLGGGKSYTLSWFARHEQKVRIRKNRLYKVINLFLPKKWQIDYLPIDVFSNFPIWLGKKYGWSRAINKDIWDWKYKLPVNSIIIYDELANDLPNVKDGKAVISNDRLKFCLRWFRHGTNATIYACSQSLSEVDKTFRAKVQHCYNLSDFHKGFLFNRINVVESFISEDITTIYSDTDKSHIVNMWRSRLPKNTYESRYGKKLYDIDDDLISYVATHSNEIMGMCGIKNGDRWTSYTYDISNKAVRDYMKNLSK